MKDFFLYFLKVLENALSALCILLARLNFYARLNFEDFQLFHFLNNSFFNREQQHHLECIKIFSVHNSIPSL